MRKPRSLQRVEVPQCRKSVAVVVVGGHWVVDHTGRDGKFVPPLREVAKHEERKTRCSQSGDASVSLSIFPVPTVFALARPSSCHAWAIWRGMNSVCLLDKNHGKKKRQCPIEGRDPPRAVPLLMHGMKSVITNQGV